MRKAYIILAVTCLLALAGCGKEETIDLNSFMTVEFSGWNGEGTASPEFDLAAYGQEAEGRIKYKGSGKEGVLPYTLLYEDYIYYDVVPSSGLSNGDLVKVKWDIVDEDIAGMFKGKVLYEDTDVIVEGLEEKPAVLMEPAADPGASGSTVKNGELVTKTDEYPKYIKDLQGVSNEIFYMMDERLQDRLIASYIDKAVITEIDPIGNFFLIAKDDKASTKNMLYYVYRVTADNEKLPGPVSFYWFGCFKNIVLLEDGTCSVNLSDFETPSNYTIQVAKNMSWNGSKDIDTLLNRICVQNLEKYDYISTIDINEVHKKENGYVLEEYKDGSGDADVTKKVVKDPESPDGNTGITEKETPEEAKAAVPVRNDGDIGETGEIYEITEIEEM